MYSRIPVHGISNLLQPAQAEVVLGHPSTYLASWACTLPDNYLLILLLRHILEYKTSQKAGAILADEKPVNTVTWWQNFQPMYEYIAL
jgi:hypothetical protein